MSLSFRIVGSLALALLLGAAAAEQAAAKTPVIFDTDIGDDIDDTWALAMLLRIPDFDLKLVTTTCGKAEYRAKLIARLLTVAKRSDVPIGLGEGGRDGTGRQEAWVKDYKLTDYPGKIHQDGVAAIIDLIEKSPQPVTIIAVGPLHTLAAALERRPEIAGKADFVGMHGCVRRGFGNSKVPIPEYNVKINVPASRKVLSAPWRHAAITPLDTCGLVRLAGKRFQTLKESRDPLLAAVLENYRLWSKKEQLEQLDASSILFDTAAVYLACPGRWPLMKREMLPISVDDKGLTAIDPAGAKIDVATDWTDLDAYHDLLVATLLGK